MEGFSASAADAGSTMRRRSSGADRWTAVACIGCPVVHPFKENIGFGDCEMPVLERQLEDRDPNLRKRALNAMKERVRDPQHAACLSEDDAVRAFHKLAKDPVLEIRSLLGEVFISLTSSANGREYFVNNLLYRQALDMLEDENDNIRKLFYQTLNQLVIIPMGSDAIVSADGIPKLVSRIAVEPMINQAAVLRVLHYCIMQRPKVAVELGAVPLVVNLLNSKSPKIRENAAECLFDLTVDREGRLEAIRLEVIPVLLNLCEDISNILVVCKSMAALMMIVNCTPGKLEAIENGAVLRLLPLLEVDRLEVRLNCLQALTSLAEAPEGKQLLLHNIDKILQLSLDPSETVQRFVKRAARVIKSIPM